MLETFTLIGIITVGSLIASLIGYIVTKYTRFEQLLDNLADKWL